MRQEYKEALAWLRSCESDQLAASDDPTSSYVASQLGLVIELLEGCAVDPIPLSERLPGAGGCDANGRCWCWDPAADPDITDGIPSWELSHWEMHHTHWLPASVEFLPARVKP